MKESGFDVAKKLDTLSIAAIIYMLNPTVAHAEGNAFGITMGQSVTALHIIKTIRPNVYKITVPLPNREFESYYVFATKKQGVCKVVASGRDHNDDRYGADTKLSYNKIKEGLSTKYGTFEEFDFLRDGALWRDSNDWVMSIKQHERTLRVFWVSDVNSNLPTEVQGIDLSVEATEIDSSYIRLGYEFSNLAACESEKDIIENSGL